MTRCGLPSVLLRGGMSPNRFGLARRTKVLWQASQHMPYLKMVWTCADIYRQYSHHKVAAELNLFNVSIDKKIAKIKLSFNLGYPSCQADDAFSSAGSELPHHRKHPSLGNQQRSLEAYAGSRQTDAATGYGSTDIQQKETNSPLVHHA